MKEARWVLLAVLGSACGSTAVDTTQDRRLEGVEQENADLRTELTSANEALATVTARLDALEAHERLVAAEVIQDGLPADGVSDDVEGLAAQLAASRLDALDDGASASCADICVTDAELTDELADYAAGADVATLATRLAAVENAYVVSGDLTNYALASDVAAVTGRVSTIEGNYLVSGALAGYVSAVDFSALTGRVVSIEGDYLVAGDLNGYAIDAELAAVAGRVSTIEGDCLQAADLTSYATQTWVATNYPEQGELDAVEADLAGAQLTLDDHEARLAVLEADAITATEVAAADAVVAALAEDLVGDLSDAVAADYVTSDVVIPVADCDALITELDALDRKRFAAGVTVELNVAVGDHACPDAIVLHHPQGDQISIMGDLDHPEMVRLNFAGSGVLAPDGHHLGLIDGITLAGQGVYGSYGLGAWFGGSFNAGSHVVVQDFYRGVGAHSGGSFFARGVTVSGCTDGFYADGAFGDAMEGAVVNGSGTGFFAEHGGVLIASNSATQDVVGGGFQAFSNAYVDAQGSDVLRSSGGFVARNGAVIFAADATATSVDYGVESHVGSTIIATGLVVTDSAGYGMVARYGSTLIATEATVSGTGSDAFLANWGSVVATAMSSSTNVGGSGLVLAMGSVGDGTGMTVNQSEDSAAKVVTGSVAELYGSHVSSATGYGFQVESGAYAHTTAAGPGDLGGNAAGFFNDVTNAPANRNSWIER